MKVLFLDTVHSVLQRKLEHWGMECIDGTQLTMPDCQNILGDIQGIVVRARFVMDEQLLKYAPNLQFIARSGAGMENIDMDYCRQHNITVVNAPEGNRAAVAEHALGMILALLNKLTHADHQIRNGIWNREANRGVELNERTVGIIGYGNNGSAFAKALSGFDCEILAYDKYKTNFSNDYVHEVTLETLYQYADVISFHIPQNEQTLFWADEHFFDAVKRPFYLINVARGKIVKTSALIRAIESGKVLGAALDVLEYENFSFEQMFEGKLPTELEYLIKSDKVLLSPHVAGWTHESYRKLSTTLAKKIINLFQEMS